MNSFQKHSNNEERPTNSKIVQPLLDPGVVVKPKKKRKKTGTKEERLRRREEKKLNDIYSPKDTRISLISPAVLEQFKGLSISQPKRIPTSSRIDEQILSSVEQFNQVVKVNQKLGEVKDSNEVIYSDIDFPTLGTPATKFPIPSTSVKIKSKVEQEATTVQIFPVASSSTPTPKVIPTSSVSKGRAKKPLVISISEFLKAKNESKVIPNESVIVKGKLRNTKLGNKQQNDKSFQKPGNILDSSGPIVIHRGKIRKPKIKKLSPLKRAILTSRALRKVTIGAHFGPGQNIKISLMTMTEPILDTTTTQLKIEPEEEEIPGSSCFTELSSSSSIPNAIEFDSLIEKDNNSISYEEILFKKLVQDSINESQKKLIPIPIDIINQVKFQLHSRKFRTYCDMYVSKELHGHVIGLLKFLHRLQDKLYHTDPIKYSMKKRYVIGLKNVTSYVSLNKIQFIIIAPDIEENNVEGGLNEKVEDLIELAKNQKIPYIFTGHRYILGHPIFIKTPVSCIGILDYQGGEDFLKKILEMANNLRDNYKTDFDQRVQELYKTQPSYTMKN